MVLGLVAFRQRYGDLESKTSPAIAAVDWMCVQKLTKEFKNDKDIQFVAVQTVFEGASVNTPEKAWSMIDRYKLSIPFGHSGGANEMSKLMKNYRTRGTPWVVIIDRKGVVRFNDFHVNPDTAGKFLRQLKSEK